MPQDATIISELSDVSDHAVTIDLAESEIDKAMFLTLVGIRNRTRLQNLTSMSVLALCALVGERTDYIWLLFSLFAAQIITSLCANLLLQHYQRIGIVSMRAFGKSPLRIGLAFVEGILWGLMMLPFAKTLGSDIASSFACTTIIVTLCLTCVVNSLERNWATICFVGFLMALLPQCIYFYEIIGPLPFIATLSLTPVIAVLPKTIRDQTRRIVCTQLEKEQLSKRLSAALIESSHLAKIDALTGLLNRRAFEERADVMRAQTHANPHLGLILVDLDHFKDINDTFGHAMGDLVLKKTAVCLAEITHDAPQLGGNDAAIARWGGEEFIMLVRTTDFAALIDLAEQMRAALIEAREPDWPSEMLVTGSFGVATWQPDTSLHEAINEADEAMYSAKVAGRNRIRAYDEKDTSGIRRLKRQSPYVLKHA